ncbi:archease [Streptomyces sp. NPDC006334]|uniref:archease n=1 Tax=Streptomyces sp. NPDC006334 TaxID=3156754 RepID=UPI0033B0B651
MVGDADDDRQARRFGSSGHRAVQHEEDVRIDAWGTSRERCLVEAALGMVECFADITAVRPTAVERFQLAECSDDDLLSALLDEVAHRLEACGQVPVDVEAETTDDGMDVRLAVVALSDVEAVGPVPSCLGWHELRIGPDPYGWSCAVTVEV